uniref:Uncharacterized protein n=1 Tax=Aegilops tauschii subsp. strangulata TaxID=200361 RepID=A0A453MYM2_AEGTS
LFLMIPSRCHCSCWPISVWVDQLVSITKTQSTSRMSFLPGSILMRSGDYCCVSNSASPMMKPWRSFSDLHWPHRQGCHGPWRNQVPEDMSFSQATSNASCLDSASVHS